ncbi:hypothetical protein SNOG_05215 [Parastagonospora nodorum SN15]|uniref:Uncharacterized protein n=1 Tax=Phaeosphaeria nodorum (strain SN15 / ATCC MYA-4574 / FGSC 10173) TaxID=321614 RepID=Q0USP9_PHANO|nr:hypothetical protein SNOG_05215 [Parastagonospora nodorum SN15]EAT87606.2 hypothetical protein SNOG_05215 [Parastagonospora nodorum SN15]
MEQDPRPANKLRKRSKSRDRQGVTMSGGLSGHPANTLQPMTSANNTTSAEERKKSKFRLSNPFHSKEKDRDNMRKDTIEPPKEHNPKRDTVDTNFDSADTYRDAGTGNIVTTTTTRNNIRNRLELDSVSPAVQRPNPMDTPVSPITPGSPSNKANFSYPSRAPPPGVPRQIPGQLQPGQMQAGHQQPTPQQWGEAWSTQQHNGYDTDASRPIPFRAGHTPQPPPQGVPQKQATLASLKAAAHGIHGAGEALRGTFNNTVDRRFAPADSAVHAKNQAVIEAGRSEIESQNFASRPRPPAADAPPVPPIPGKQPYSGPAISGSQLESGGRGAGKLSGFMKKMKDGPMASNRDGTVGTQ